MQRIAAIAVLALLTGNATAQERIPPETATKFAQLFVGEAAKAGEMPLKIDADPERSYGLKIADGGVLIIPDKRLAADTLDKAGETVTPLGQLWTKDITALVKDQPVPTNQLRTVSVTIGDNTHSLVLFLVGVRKGKEGPELVVYARDNQPLTQVPLQKAQGNQEMPIDLEAQGDAGRGTLTFSILGQYRARLPMARQE